MNAKRILMILLAFVLTFSLIACDSKDDKSKDTDEVDSTGNENNAEESTDMEETTGEKPKEIVNKTYKLTEILDTIKVFGRTTSTAQGLTCDFTASGIEFNAYIEGKLTVSVTVSKGVSDAATDDCYFTLYVDGVRSETRFKATKSTTTTLELASFATGGVHNIRLVKQTEAKQALATLSTVSFKGYFEDAPAPAKHYVEFVGDSITCGYGNLIANGGSNPHAAVNQDGTQTFAYLTAQNLGVDHSMVSVTGIGVAQGYRSFTMSSYFAANSWYRSTSVKFQPTRTPDIVVINLGTNDINKGASQSEWKSAVSALITQVRTMYGKDVPIVWVYNMMSPNTVYPQLAQEAINALGGEAAGLYMCKVTNNKAGGNGHPNLEGHKTASAELTKFIQDKKLLK